jgi:hypothetical protein
MPKLYSEAESVSLEAHISDVAFHGFVGFVATKRTIYDQTTVTQSIDDSIPVGTVLYSINKEEECDRGGGRQRSATVTEEEECDSDTCESQDAPILYRADSSQLVASCW